MIKKIINHSFWLLLGNSIGRLAMFVTNIFAARILSQEIFGQFMMVRSTINMGGNIISSALGTSATKKIAEFRQKEAEALPTIILSIFAVSLVATILLSILLFFFSEYITEYFLLGDSTLVTALYIGILLLFGITFSTLIQGIFIGFEQFRKLAYLSILVSLISIPVILITIYCYGLYGALIGVSFYFILDFIIKFFFLYSKIMNGTFSFAIKNILATSGNLVSFSTPLVLSLLLNSVSFWYARVIILNSSKGFSDIAIFDAAYQWLTIIMLITGATSSVALPMLSRAFGKNNKKELSKIFYVNLAVNGSISIGIALFFILLSKQIMAIYGTEYIQGSSILIVLSITSILFSISSIYNKYMVAHNKVWTVFVASLLGMATLFLILNYTIHLKALGLAWAFLGYYGSLVLTFILSTGYIHLRVCKSNT